MHKPKLKKALVIKDLSKFTVKEIFGTKQIEVNDSFILSLIKRAIDKLEGGER